MRGVLVDRFTLEGWLDYVRRYRPEIGNVPTSALQTILEQTFLRLTSRPCARS